MGSFNRHAPPTSGDQEKLTDLSLPLARSNWVRFTAPGLPDTRIEKREKNDICPALTGPVHEYPSPGEKWVRLIGAPTPGN